MPLAQIPRLATIATALAVAAIVATAVNHSSANASVADSSNTLSHKRHNVAVSAHWENPPDSFVLSPPCTQTDYIPTIGLCHGTGAGNATITGSWQGATTYVYGFATTPANLTYVTVLETFTGTVTGCGTGAMTYRLAGTVDPAGTINDQWQIVEGFGSGDLAGVTGHGTQLGTYNADFSQTGDFRGHLNCDRHPDHHT